VARSKQKIEKDRHNRILDQESEPKGSFNSLYH